MVRVREERSNRRVELIGTDRPISILCVEAGNQRIEVSNVDQRVHASRSWRIVVEPVLGDLLFSEIVPGLDGSHPLPEESQAGGCKGSPGGRYCSREVLYLGELSRHLRRVARRWRSGSELTP